MVQVFSKNDAEEKVRHYGWRCNYMHHYESRPFSGGFAVVQTDATEPHYLCTNGSFWPINQ